MSSRRSSWRILETRCHEQLNSRPVAPDCSARELKRVDTNLAISQRVLRSIQMKRCPAAEGIDPNDWHLASMRRGIIAVAHLCVCCRCGILPSKCHAAPRLPARNEVYGLRKVRGAERHENRHGLRDRRRVISAQGVVRHLYDLLVARGAATG
jgi:hypothetical protein